MVDPARRRFLRGRRPDPGEASPMRPPWSLRPDDAFVTACTRCGDCVRACPEKVLFTGDGGFPEIRFSTSGCTLCGECDRACPTDAIDRAGAGEAFAWRVQVSPACLARHGVECRVCGDACDTRALRFVPAPGGIAQMRISPADCSGCGACLPTCPVAALSLK